MSKSVFKLYIDEAPDGVTDYPAVADVGEAAAWALERHDYRIAQALASLAAALEEAEYRRVVELAGRRAMASVPLVGQTRTEHPRTGEEDDPVNTRINFPTSDGTGINFSAPTGHGVCSTCGTIIDVFEDPDLTLYLHHNRAVDTDHAAVIMRTDAGDTAVIPVPAEDDLAAVDLDHALERESQDMPSAGRTPEWAPSEVCLHCGERIVHFRGRWAHEAAASQDGIALVHPCQVDPEAPTPMVRTVATPRH